MFGNVFDFLLPASFAHSPVPFAQRVIRKRVVQAQHGPRVPHFCKPFARRAAHANGQRIRRDQFRMRGFQFLQPVHHPVVSRVRDFRIIQDVVAVFVVAQLLAKLFNLFFDASGRSLGHKTPRSFPGSSFRAVARASRPEESFFGASLRPVIPSGARNLLLLFRAIAAETLREIA